MKFIILTVVVAMSLLVGINCKPADETANEEESKPSGEATSPPHHRSTFNYGPGEPRAPASFKNGTRHSEPHFSRSHRTTSRATETTPEGDTDGAEANPETQAMMKGEESPKIQSHIAQINSTRKAEHRREHDKAGPSAEESTNEPEEAKDPEESETGEKRERRCGRGENQSSSSTTEAA